MNDTSPRAAAPSKRVAIPGGSLHIADYPGDGSAIVMMHGFPDDSRIYDRLIPLLAPQCAVAFDWLGYGRSGRTGAGFADSCPADLVVDRSIDKPPRVRLRG
jgi:pimeloyl-ACP methyl ester carboxylesterase